MPLFRRKTDARLHEIGEAEAYGRSYGDASRDVRIVKVEPRRPRYQLKVTGEALRNAFLDRLNRRDPADRPDEPPQG
ncbi:MAG TPA: hypothetical protein VG144_11840 [Gaiellaceae bacterium]|nr:hypothetical protein [Gaiellaceae bacterium]